jgi:hypothetical protein
MGDEPLSLQPNMTGTATQKSGAASDGSEGMSGSVAQMEAQKRLLVAKRQREIIHSRETEVKMSTRLGELVIPFIVLGILALITSFFLIPSIAEIIENQRQISTLRAEIKEKQAKVEVLQSINVEDLETKLSMVTKVVRDDMNVSELAGEIDALALVNNLSPSGESVANATGLVGKPSDESEPAFDWKPQYADTLNGPFSFSGTFTDICNFINDLRLRSSTILSLGEVTVARRSVVTDVAGQAVETWYVNLSVKGYTVAPQTDASVDDPVVTELDEDVLGEISDRAADVQTGQDGAADEDQGGTDGPAAE